MYKGNGRDTRMTSDLFTKIVNKIEYTSHLFTIFDFEQVNVS